MYGVDMTKPGAQAYYDSVFALLASWGVDFVKIDDIAGPYRRNQPEIEAVRRAIDRSGPADAAQPLAGRDRHWRPPPMSRPMRNMWRISDDFWDEWRLLVEQFARLGELGAIQAPRRLARRRHAAARPARARPEAHPLHA